MKPNHNTSRKRTKRKEEGTWTTERCPLPAFSPYWKFVPIVLYLAFSNLRQPGTMYSMFKFNIKKSSFLALPALHTYCKSKVHIAKSPSMISCLPVCTVLLKKRTKNWGKIGIGGNTKKRILHTLVLAFWCFFCPNFETDPN